MRQFFSDLQFPSLMSGGSGSTFLIRSFGLITSLWSSATHCLNGGLQGLCVTTMGGRMSVYIYIYIHTHTHTRGSLIMFCNLVFQQHLQPLCLLQFFEETSLSLYTFDHPLKLAVYDTSPDHVGWGMSKITSSKNAWTSLAFWNCFPFSCVLVEGYKNQSQGAKSGEYCGCVTSWTILADRKSSVTAAVCALALSWWSSRPWTPDRGRRLHHAWKTLGKQYLTYQSAVTVFLSSSGMVAMWPNFAKKIAIILFGTFFDSFEFHRWVLIWEDPHRRLLLRRGSYWYTQVPSPVTMSQTWGDLPLSTFLSM